MEPLDDSNQHSEISDSVNIEDISESDVIGNEAVNKDINVDNLDKVCRVCLSETEVNSLHKNKDYPTFIFLLQICHKSSIPIDNIYPSKICETCSLDLENISNFILKLKDTTQTLNALYEQDIEIIECENQTNSMDRDDDEVEETIIIEEDINEEEQHIGFKGFKCEPCNRTFNYFTSWQCHMIRHEEINKNKCQYCDWISIDEKTYQEHLKTEHDDLINPDIKPKKFASLTVDGQFKCNTCELTFDASSSLKKHISTHEQVNVECEICGKIFVDHFRCQLHLETIHGNQEVKPKMKKVQRKEKPGEYICESCNKQFVFKSSLNRHVQIAHGQSKRFSCDICGEKFTVKNSLKYHLYIHTNAKPFSCNLCPKAFRQPTALIRHQRGKHSTKREFLCDICFKMFKTSQGLENHSKKHAKGLI